MNKSDVFDLYQEESKSRKKNPNGDVFDQYTQQTGQDEEPWYKSFARTVMQPVQGVLSTTGPGLIASAWEALAQGEIMDPEEIEHIKMISEREGVPFDEEAYYQAAEKALSAIPTVSNIARGIEEKTGAPLEPKTKLQKGLRLGTELLSGGFKGKKVPTLKPKSLGSEEQALRETAEQFNLRKFAGMEAEKEPFITPIVSPAKEAKLRTELTDTTKKAINDIIDQKIPIRKMRESGVDLTEAYQTAYQKSRSTASEMGNEQINFSNVIQWINSEVKRVKSTAPSLSGNQKAYLNVLRKEKSAFLKPKKPEPKIDESKQLISITGEPLIKPKPVKREIKQMNADQALNQYRNFNENVESIWRKPEFSGHENAVKNAYAGLKEQLINSISNADSELGNELQFANKIFHEKSKLDEVENILSKSFKDGYDTNKLAKTLSGKRDRKFLERNIGKDSIKDLEKIAKYGQKAQEKIFNNIQNPKTLKDYVNKMTPTQLALLVGFKSHIGIPISLSKAGINRIQGYLFTRNSTKKSYINFLKEASNLGKNPSPLFIASKKLNESITEEFGSEEELRNMSSQEE